MGKRGKRSRGGAGRRVLRQGDRNVFGEAARQLPLAQLPLNKEIGLQVLGFEQFEGLTRDEAVKRTAVAVEELYKKASIPTIAQTSIERKIRKLMVLKREREKVEEVDNRTGKKKDQGKQKRKKKNNKLKVKVQEVLEDIFEVKTEVPELEKGFYEDQCSERKMFIGGIDEEETSRLEDEAKRKKKKDERVSKEKEKIKKMKEKEMEEAKKYNKVEWSDDNHNEEGEEREDNNDKSFKCREKSRAYSTETEKKRKRMSKDEEELVGDFLEHCERFKVSETGASTLLNLRNKKLRLCQSQINRKKKKLRLKQVEEFKPDEVPEAIGFDERIDKTKVEVGKGAKGRKRFEVKKEEHCAVILYPGEQFAGHVVPGDGTGAGLARDLVAFARERVISLEEVRHLVSDGCEKMVGWITGVHATMEHILEKPFQRVICSGESKTLSQGPKSKYQKMCFSHFFRLKLKTEPTLR